MKSISTFLMFTNNRAEEALALYCSLFDGAKIENLTRWEEGNLAGQIPGAIQQAVFTIKGESFLVMDSSGHSFGFTPAVSLYVNCADEAEIRKAFEGLSEGGAVLMPLGEYPFAKHYAWVQDKFGLSWQLSFAG